MNEQFKPLPEFFEGDKVLDRAINSEGVVREYSYSMLEQAWVYWVQPNNRNVWIGRLASDLQLIERVDGI